MVRFKVQWLVLASGERMPLLKAATDVGPMAPMFRPTLWLISMRRARGLAANTLHADLQSLSRLYEWADVERVDIERRMLDGRFLTNGELDSLVRGFRTRKAEQFPTPRGTARRGQVLQDEVSKHTWTSRLAVASEYMGWLSDEGISQALPAIEAAARASQRDEMADRLRQRMPRHRGRNVVGTREGPAKDTVEALKACIELDSAENPWEDLGLRARNRLLVTMFLALGLRRGEALGLRMERIDFQGDAARGVLPSILVARAPDDPDDPRTFQPLAKTRDRRLPLKGSLAGMIHDYVVGVRSKIPGAGRHSFLFVSHQDGQPLSLSAVNKVFRTLRLRVPTLPENLTPHLLRHAWNDAWSDLMDRKKITPEREAQMRTEMMGWSPTSQMAAVYTRRHARETANRVSVEHQAEIMDGGKP